jgi:ABC-type transport system substrate-binding protein
MRRRDLVASLPALGAFDALAQPGARKTLRVAFPTSETALDPAQNNTDLYSSTILAQILEAPLTFDYLARPAKLVTATAAALPDVSADGRRFTIRLQPGIYFGTDTAFKGQRRELVAADYVYSIKRFYDPKYNSSDLYLY